MKFERKVSKWGNSNGIRIPKTLLSELGMVEMEYRFDMKVDGNVMYLLPLHGVQPASVQEMKLKKWGNSWAFVMKKTFLPQFRTQLDSLRFELTVIDGVLRITALQEAGERETSVNKMKLAKWGNSSGIRIPKEVLFALGIGPEREVFFNATVRNDEIVLKLIDDRI